MSVRTCSWPLGLLAASGLMALSACAVTGVGVDYDGPEYVGGFYEPYGYDYGGWGGGYRVGPPRGGERGPGGDHGPRGDHGPGGGGGRPYRSAPAGHGMPSIPGRARGR
jgi:hypothetical protein